MSVGTPRGTGLRAVRLLDVLREHAEHDPLAIAFTFPRFDDRTGAELPAETLTREALDTRARAVAATLQQRGVGTGRVLLLLTPGPDFIAALFGCYYAGAGVVACAPPKAGADGAMTERFAQIGADADVAAVVTHGAPAVELRRLWDESGAPDRPWIDIDGECAEATLWTPPRISGDDLAIIQYTSGSTGMPKGVMVSQDNLIEQLRVFRDLAELPDGCEVVTWMPIYHALGIAGTVTMSQFIGGRCTQLTPDDFVAEPFRWLKAISDASGPVFSCGPNFAYDRCVEQVTPRQREMLDLRHWHSAFNAAERIQHRTIEQFTATFEPHGFHRAAWFPGYGLTEVTLGVCGRRGPDPLVLTVDAARLERGHAEPVAGDAEGRSTGLVGCGVPHPRVRMLVVDPDTRKECGAGEVGEIWISGTVVNQGYWNRPEQTAETFGGYLADGSGPFLRTGDLALWHDGDLVVCGRLKELIIIRGRNIHPQDVEAAARTAHPALATAPAAAFSVDHDEGERLVLVQAVPDPDELDLTALAADVRAAVVTGLEVEPYEITFVGSGDVPMTGSGKIRRTTCRQAYLDGEITALRTGGSAPPASPAAEDTGGGGTPLRDMVLGIPEELRGQVVAAEVRRRVAAAVGGVPADVPGDRPLIALGLESLRIVELRYALGRDFGVELPMADFVRGGVTDVVGRVLRDLDGDGSGGIDWPRLTADPENRHEPFPLTEIQLGYLVGRGDAYDLGGTSIHLYTEYDTPELDADRLRQALNALVRRHEMLRAVVSADGNQRILADVGDVPVVEYDLRSATPEELDAHIEQVRAELDHQVLPLDTWPMFDFRVTWVEGVHARVHVSLDLLVADVASVRLLFLELGDLYRSPGAVPPVPDVSFRDYVIAARGIRDTAAYEASRTYWTERVASLPPNPQLPRVATAPGEPPRRVRRLGRLEADRWRRVRERAAARGVTPSAVQLAAYAIVLGAWSGSGHFTIDVPLFNRHPLHPDIDRVIGDFTSVTLLEIDLRTDDTFATVAERIQQRLWRDLDHRFFSGVEVIREITRTRSLPVSSFASVVFASAREQGRDQEFRHGDLGADWLGETVHSVSQTPQVLLDHQVYEDRGALTYKWDAVEAMFPPGVVDAMFAAHERLLSTLADDEDAWVRDDFDIRPEDERRLVAAANDTADDAVTEDGELLCTAIVDQARRHPDRVAVIAEDRTLDYGSLYRQASRLGRRLCDLGARPDEPVAIACRRGAAQVVAVLAAHLAGAAYMPVDPEIPPDRQDRILALSGARLILTAVPDRERPWPSGVTAVPADLDAAEGDDTPLVPPGRPEDLAYVLYTSGSTGTPKGVAQSHGAVLNTIVDFTRRCGLGADDRAIALSALGFDLSAGDLFSILRVGGALVVPSERDARSPARWLDLMAEHRVTTWNSVPALMRMLTDHLDGSAHPGLAALRLVWLSGDWIPVDLPGRIRAVAPRARIVASGGPTETAIWCVAHDVTEADADRAAIPYGTPMRNHTIEILDDRMRPCPVWVTGEMYIGGRGLAEGYWRDPGRTSEAFVTDPRTGRRLYRSGDLGRWLPSGEIEIVGRDDTQVKIRGYRVELGEIEAALLRQDEVREAAVTVVGDRENRRLAAVVVRAVPAGAPHEEVYGEALGDVLTDPLERLAFKARRHTPPAEPDGTMRLPAPARPASADTLPRASCRHYDDGPVSLAALARLLEPLSAAGNGAFPKFGYASAGALYPMRAYVYVPRGRVDDLDGGTYLYEPRTHALLPVRPGAVLGNGIHAPDNHAAFDGSAFSVFLVARRSDIEPMYGRLARDFCLLEAGLMTQLLEGAAVSCEVGLCQVGFIRDTDELRDALDLDGDAEVLHGLIGGVPAPEPADSAGSVPVGDLLRERLAAELPAHMVPTTVSEVARLPLTARGKVDRAALPGMAGSTYGAGEPAAADGGAETETESKILAIFRAELDNERITVHDRFLDVGADSVVVVRIHRTIQAALGSDFPLMAMFEYATVRRLADHLTNAPPDHDPVDDAFSRGRSRARRRMSRRRV